MRFTNITLAHIWVASDFSKHYQLPTEQFYNYTLYLSLVKLCLTGLVIHSGMQLILKDETLEDDNKHC